MTRSISSLLVLLVAAASFAPPVTGQDLPVDATRFQAAKWRNIGPFRGGRAVATAGVVSEPLTFYFGAVGSGVWKTDDAGGTWTNVSDSTFGTSSVGAISVAPSDPNVVYVGMGEHAVRGVMTSHGDGMYRSTDAGRSWAHIGLSGSRAISRIQVHPSNPDVVYVAVQGAPYGPTDERGIFRSADGGLNWEHVLFVSDVAGASDLAMDPSNPRILYAAFWDHQRFPWQVRSGGPGSGFFKSTDGGSTWVEINEGLPELMGKTDITVSADSDRLYALVEADPAGGLYRSNDAGKTWKLVNGSPTIRARPWYYINVFADPKNADVIWVLNAPIMKSIDGGRSFQQVRATHGDNHDLWINPDQPDIMINANDGGASVTLNGGRTWSSQANQPTAQFYRVNTDNRFPYYVYGGQQDNSAIAIPSAAPGAGIGVKDWYSVAGCETAYVAFDPDNPVTNFGGCYMGLISAFDETTRTSRDAMAYPFLPAAMASRDMKYRFNWNAPILASQHDPSIIYHAANRVLRSSDKGITWTEISPDLTRNDDAQQGPGGGPITVEGAGGETYNTIMYVAESPHDPSTLWTGSDDGLVHVTTNGGETWSNVTPDGLPEALINAIDVSPHDPASAFIAVTRYKFNDFTPMAFRTTDYGKSWKAIVDGIQPDHHVRVIREDPRTPGLLYGGTEGGLYVSWNNGDDWQPMQLNMPRTPITDLVVQTKHNDLVAATQGRSFWILDDLSPFQQTVSVDSDVHLFEPADAYRVAGGEGPGRAVPGLGQNPPPGAIIDFFAADVTDSTEVRVEIVDAAGKTIRTYGNQKDETVAGDSLKVESGHTRFSWDLREETVRNLKGVYVWGSLAGRRVPPGSFTVRLSVADQVREAPVQVLADPRIHSTASGFAEQYELIGRITDELDDLHAAVKRIRNVRAQVDAFLQRVPDDQELDSLGHALTASLDEVEEALLQKRVVDGQTVINYPARLRFQYIFLRGQLDSSEGEVTAGSHQHAADLSTAWNRERGKLDRLLREDLERFNGIVSARSIPAIVVPDEQGN